MANLFSQGDRVKTTNGARSRGRVYLVACSLATATGGKICDPKTCQHPTKKYVWVMWPGMNKSYSYHYNELAYDLSPVESDEKREKIEVKDDYIEKAKQTIKDAVRPPKPELDKEFWRLYGGFDKVKFDRSGRPFVHEVKMDERPPLKLEEIDWQRYHGFVRSKTYRKDV